MQCVFGVASDFFSASAPLVPGLNVSCEQISLLLSFRHILSHCCTLTSSTAIKDQHRKLLHRK